jgi:predicted enzyme related to lactoylglutathione lyase
MNYDNFFYPSENLEESKRFYKDVLGLSVKFDFSEQGMIAFNVGDEEPAIILKDKNKFPKVKPAVWFQVDNVKAMYEELLSKDVHFLSEPFKIRTGWAVEFNDPSGNVIGITDYE